MTTKWIRILSIHLYTIKHKPSQNLVQGHSRMWNNKSQIMCTKINYSSISFYLRTRPDEAIKCVPFDIAAASALHQASSTNINNTFNPSRKIIATDLQKQNKKNISIYIQIMYNQVQHLRSKKIWLIWCGAVRSVGATEAAIVWVTIRRIHIWL